MTEYAKRNVYLERFTYAAAGLIVGGLLTFGVLKLFSISAPFDDEQPPIIVRGGSLLFEWDEPWISQPSNTWVRRMPGRISPGSFEVTFEPASCQPKTVPWFNVFYDPDDAATAAAEETFEVLFVPRPGSPNEQVPAVRGPNLVPADRHTLKREGTSSAIVRVEGPGGQVLCTAPTKITAKPRK